MRLVDADALLDRIPNLYERREVSRWVDEAPTVDAVPVVRCKDCRWRKDKSVTTAWMPCRALVTPDDFSCIVCERKDGDHAEGSV